jgi:hypothetical protein
MKVWQWFKEEPWWSKALLFVPVVLVVGAALLWRLWPRRAAMEPAPVPVSPAAPVDDAVTAHVAEINEELGAKEAQTDEAKNKVDDASGFAAVDAVLYGTRHGGSTGPAPRD